MSVTYEDVLAARERIGDDLEATPLVPAYGLEGRLDGRVSLKAESLQRTGSFKPRGVLNWIRTATERELAAGLIAVSAGNHASALAWAAQAVGVDLTVVMPEGASPMKVEATRAHGAKVLLHGDINAAWAKAHELRESERRTLVHPYDDPRVIAGQGSVALELLRQTAPADVVLVPVGGGGLVSGMGLVLKHEWPHARVVGVEPEEAATLHYAWQQGGPATLPRAGSIAPALGANRAGDHTFAVSRKVVDDITLVCDDDIRVAMRAMLSDCRLVAEPGGVVALAALLSGRVPLRADERAIVVVSGGNLDLDQLGDLI